MMGTIQTLLKDRIFPTIIRIHKSLTFLQTRRKLEFRKFKTELVSNKSVFKNKRDSLLNNKNNLR